MDRALTAAEAARLLGITPRHVRRLARSCGAVVAERPLRVDVERIERARAGRDVTERLAVAVLDTLRRDCGTGQPAHLALGIEARRAAGLLLFAFDRAHRELTGRESCEPLPGAIHVVRQIAGLPP